MLTEGKLRNHPHYIVILIAAIAGLGGFLFGFDSSVIANAKDQITAQFFLNDLQWSIVVSISLLGSVIGIPLSGIFSNHISRKNMLLIVAVGFIIGSILSAQTKDLSILLAGRLIIGICIGIASYVTPLFIAEIAPPRIRGGMILMNGLAITFGQAFSFLIGYLLYDISPNSWRLLLLSGAIPAALLFIGMLFVPDSPRWVMFKYGIEKTRENLQKIRRHQAEIEAELIEIEFNQKNLLTHFKIANLFSPPLLYVLIIGVALGIFQQFSGINAIMYYGPVIFTSAGFHPAKLAILATFGMGLINFIVTIITVLLVDKVGRRFLLTSGTCLAAISLIIVGFYYQQQWTDKKWLMMFFMSTYIIGYCISIGSLFWVVISEIYPLKYRGLAMSIATVAQWMANFTVSISFLTLYKYLGEAHTFWLFSIICLFACLFVYRYIPETTNVSLEKIELNLAQGKKLRELGQPLKSTTQPLSDLSSEGIT